MVRRDVLRARKGLYALLTLSAMLMTLNVLDIHSTWLCLKQVSFDTDYEGNPLARGLMERHGIADTMEWKFLSVSLGALVVFCAYPMKWYYNRISNLGFYILLMAAAVSIYMVVVSLNYLGWFLSYS